MQFSRFTALLLGALLATMLLTLIAAIAGFAAALGYVSGAGFVTALLAIVVARMLETNAGHAASSPDAERPATTNAAPRAATARENTRERQPIARAAQTESPPATANGTRLYGNVKWFNRAKGYGFIHCDDEREVFVHHRNLRGGERQALQDGERVSFHIVERSRGPQAEDVAVELR